MLRIISILIICLASNVLFGQKKRDQIMKVDSIFHTSLLKYVSCDNTEFERNFSLYRNFGLKIKDKSISNSKMQIELNKEYKELKSEFTKCNLKDFEIEDYAIDVKENSNPNYDYSEIWIRLKNKNTLAEGFLLMRLYFYDNKYIDVLYPRIEIIDEDNRTQFNYAKEHYEGDIRK